MPHLSKRVINPLLSLFTLYHNQNTPPNCDCRKTLRIKSASILAKLFGYISISCLPLTIRPLESLFKYCTKSMRSPLVSVCGTVLPSTFIVTVDGVLLNSRSEEHTSELQSR